MGFLGWALTALIVTPMADKYGRKPWIVLSITIGTLLYIGLFKATSVAAMMVVMFFLGVTIPGRVGVCFVYAAEFLNPNQKIWFTTILGVTSGSTFVVETIYYWLIDTHYKYLTAVYVLTGVMCLIYMTLRMPESPLWLLKNNK